METPISTCHGEILGQGYNTSALESSTWYLCTDCGKGFASETTLLEHRESHKGAADGKTSDGKGSESQDLNPVDVPQQINAVVQALVATVSEIPTTTVQSTIKAGGTPSRPFVCQECGKAFLTRSHLKRHMSCHTGERPFQCDHCGKRFFRKEHLKSHILSHAGAKLYECEECPKKFIYQRELDAHSTNHSKGAAAAHTRNGSALCCCFCSLKFEETKQLQEHERSCKSRPMLKTELEGDSQMISGQANNQVITTVVDSCTTNETDVVVVLNMQANADASDATSGATLRSGKSTDRAITGTASPKRKMFQCEDCGKFYTKRNHMKRHQRIHTGERPFQCEICERRFYRKEHLKCHMRMHTGKRPYLCNECGKAFASQSYIRIHKCKPGSSMSFCCRICNESFNEQKQFEEHTEKHNSDEPIEAMKEASTIDTSTIGNQLLKSLTENQGQTTSISDVEMVQATQTLQATATQSSLATNPIMSVHVVKPIQAVMRDGKESFKCDECGKFYVKRSHLKRHQRLHTGERPYACDVCQQRFYRREHLNSHMKSHTGEKPFLCSECGRCFTLMSYLDNHRCTYGKLKYCSDCHKAFTNDFELGIHKRSYCKAMNLSSPGQEREAEEADNSEELQSQYVAMQNKSMVVPTTNDTAIALASISAAAANAGESTAANIDEADLPESKLDFKCSFCPGAFASAEQLFHHEAVCPVRQKYLKTPAAQEDTTIQNEAGQNIVALVQVSGEGMVGNATLTTAMQDGQITQCINANEGVCENGTFKCSHCEQSFETELHLTNHEAFHVKERPFICGVCSHSFYQRDHLVKHQLIHSTGKPYVCDQCGQGFDESSDYNEHERLHAEQVIHECEACGEQYQSQSAFLQHQQEHKARPSMIMLAEQ